MSIEIAGLIVTTLGVVVAFFAWWYPKHPKSTSAVTFKDPARGRLHTLPPDYCNQIEVAFKHLESTTFDDERTEYIEGLAKRLGGIELTDLSKLISYLVHDENRIRSVKAFSGKVSDGYTASHYENLLNEFVFSKNKQKAAAYVNKR